MEAFALLRNSMLRDNNILSTLHMFCPLCAHLYLCSLAWETYAKWTELFFFFAQTRKGNTSIRIKFDIYFVNDEKVLQKQGVLNFDNKDQ